ncbi:MAG TPA: hypothetical protein VEL28_13110 [Candidatus Binatia bacterium]|nr:hypothetical protein [Candidatus Binatia bacterium]
MAGWFDDEDEPFWDGQRRPTSSSAPKAPAEEGYAVLYMPAICPRCRMYDQVEVTSTRLQETPPKRYHRCRRCNVTFKSLEAEQDENGNLVLRRSTYLRA